jgi:hypothetical protein
MTNSSAPDGNTPPRFEHLLQDAGYAPPWTCAPITGGANSRVYRIDITGGPLLLKAYYRHPDDQRDRLGADYGFTAFAWDHGVTQVARPIACDRTAGLALYEFVEGTKLEAEAIGWDAVEQALAFFQAVNAHRANERAAQLPSAAEACFSLQAHLDVIGRRLARLRTIDGAAAVDRAAAQVVRTRLDPLGAAALAAVTTEAARRGVALDGQIGPADRCLSPSDFGFHNALWPADGGLKFIDFEYAGWDDPGKMIADFFCQPERPVSMEYFERFAAAVAAQLAEPERERWRFGLLLPLYRIKWCCIMLNDFLPAASLRRRFAHGDIGEAERKARQLARAVQAVHAIEAWKGHRAA